MGLHFKQVFDSFIVFSKPLELYNDNGENIKIYGLLYFKEDTHNDNLWQWKLNRYIAYLVGCTRLQDNNGYLQPETFITPQGLKIELSNSLKNFIYDTLKNELPSYTTVEHAYSLILEDSEHEGRFIISDSILEKYYPYWNTKEKNESL